MIQKFYLMLKKLFLDKSHCYRDNIKKYDFNAIYFLSKMQVGFLHTQIFHVVSRTKDVISRNCNKNNVIDKN